MKQAGLHSSIRPRTDGIPGRQDVLTPLHEGIGVACRRSAGPSGDALQVHSAYKAKAMVQPLHAELKESHCAHVSCWWLRAAASPSEVASRNACCVTASPSEAYIWLKAHLEIEGSRVQGAAVQALKHVRQQGSQQLRGSRSEGAQPAQPLLCKHVHTALTRHCSAVLTLLAYCWNSCSMTVFNETVLPATAAGTAS